MIVDSTTSKARQSRFQIVWMPGGEPTFFYTDDKVIATAHVAAIVATEFGRGFVPEVEEGSTMESIIRPDGSHDQWNKILVHRYIIRATKVSV